MFREDLVFVTDFDGILTDGKMYYSKYGKQFKCVGCEDWDLLKELSLFIKVNIITADKRGFPITHKRVEDEMQLELDLVNGNGQLRWDWIKKKYPVEEIIYMGDSLGDMYSLKKADYGITVVDALQCVKDSADLVVQRRGGDRAVAEAIIHINKIYNIFKIIE